MDHKDILNSPTIQEMQDEIRNLRTDLTTLLYFLNNSGNLKIRINLDKNGRIKYKNK